jgi:hypothetical protein
LYIPTRAFGEKPAVSPEEMEKAYDIIQNNTPRIDRTSLLEHEHQHIVDE